MANEILVTLFKVTTKRKKTTKPKVSRRKKITKIIAEINKIESKKSIQKINETKGLFFEEKNKICKPLTRYIKKKAEMTQIKSEMKEEN